MVYILFQFLSSEEALGGVGLILPQSAGVGENNGITVALQLGIERQSFVELLVGCLVRSFISSVIFS